MRRAIRPGRALLEARELGHPFSLAYAHSGAAFLYQLLGDPEAVRIDSEAMMSLASDHGFSLFLAESHCFRGWARAVGGREEAGVAEITDGIAGWRAAGAKLLVSYFVGRLAEAQRTIGQGEEALSSVKEALQITKQTGERWWQPELLRLEGELLAERSLRMRGERRAEIRARALASLRRAVKVARAQGAAAVAERARRSLENV